MLIAISYVHDDGTRHEFYCAPGERAHREALEHEAAGVCVVIETIELDAEGIPF